MSAVLAQTSGQRRVLAVALALNAIMFAVGMIAGVLGRSSSLIADALDMLADASAYAIALMAITRGPGFKASASLLSGSLLLLLGIGVLGDAVRRCLFGGSPEGLVMVATAAVSLVVNGAVLRMLGRFRNDAVHLRATWIFTRADVIANVAVILSGILVVVTGLRYIDIAVGAGIGVYVIKEAFEIFGEARKARWPV